MSLDKIASKRVLIRFDYNVPMNQGMIVNDFRIKQSLETIQLLLKNKNKLILMSHLGRPKEGKYDKNNSLEPIAYYLSELLSKDIKFISSLDEQVSFDNNEICFLENARFNVGEKSCDDSLSQRYASLADIFIFDAFGVAHRKESSTYGVSEHLETYPGLNIKHEISTVNKLIKENSRPMTIIISGAKVSTKLIVIKKLLSRCDHMVLGGGILNTFLKARGYEIGLSLYEGNLIPEAKNILNSKLASKIIFPSDLLCESVNQAINKDIHAITKEDSIYDIGQDSLREIKKLINKSSSVFWNGPLGYVEKKPYDNGTIELAKTIAKHNCFSIVGGGDTLPIIENLNLQNDYSCLSTGGGSLLTYLEGESLPILAKLNL